MLVLEDVEADRSITLPPSMNCGETVEDLISNIYPNISDSERKPASGKSRFYLNLLNVALTSLNFHLS